MILRTTVFALLYLVANPLFAACEATVTVGDTLTYDTSSIAIGADCAEASITLTHTGKLPKNAMGHNWVLTKTADFDALAPAGVAAGLEGDYVPAGDARVIANTKIVGGGESDTIKFPVANLKGGDYTFFCSFPGHWAVMKGSFTVE